MARFRLTVEKYHNASAEYWVNRYYVNAADLADATLMSNGIVDAEKALYPNTVVITKSHVDDDVPLTLNYETTIRNLAGIRTAPTGDFLPLFVVARVDFSVAGGGRPSRKYLRGVLFEADTTFNTLGASILTALNTYASSVAASGACDPQGQDIIGGSPWNAPAMRQLRRGSKKKLVP